jgi:hypothetical protein
MEDLEKAESNDNFVPMVAVWAEYHYRLRLDIFERKLASAGSNFCEIAPPCLRHRGDQGPDYAPATGPGCGPRVPRRTRPRRV